MPPRFYDRPHTRLGVQGYPIAYAVRDIWIEPAVVLAPMEGVTDLAFRRLIRNLTGAGLTYTEFLASKNLRDGHKKAWKMAEFDEDERPIALQIYGREPEVMAEAAKLLEDRGATILDINMGCPSKKVCNNSGGSALMREPKLAASIVRAVRKAVSIPLTVKMRSGFDASMRNAPELAEACVAEGAEGITIHWRTREDRYDGVRAVDKIAETVDRVSSVPVIANGDVIDVASARKMFDDTKCSGVMIGRGAIRNPWVFQEVRAWLRGEEEPVVDADEKERVLLLYYNTIAEALPNPKGTLGRIKMVTKYFTETLPFGQGLRFAVLRCEDPSEAHRHVRTYFELLRRFESGDDAPLRGSLYAKTPEKKRRSKRRPPINPSSTMAV